MIAGVALTVALTVMLIELGVSMRNERRLRARGALTPRDPVYKLMRVAYPGTFVMMALEGWWSGPAPRRLVLAGIAIVVAGKLLKAWAIAVLDGRWTYRVLVLPGEPLVTRGPYRWLRHPNYVGVVAELVGFAMIVQARWSGVVAVVFFGELLRRRIQAEEAALGLSR